jgi:cell division protein FtsQ
MALPQPRDVQSVSSLPPHAVSRGRRQAPGMLPRAPAPAPAPAALRPRSGSTPPRLTADHHPSQLPHPAGSGAGRARAGRAMKALLLLGVAATSAVAVLQVARLVEAHGVLVVEDVRVVGAAADDPRVSAAEVLAYADIATGTPLLAIDKDDVVRRVLEHPWVGDAVVRLVPPSAVEIAVSQREPVALLRASDGLYLVDDRAVVMKALRPTDPFDLPLVTLTNAPGDDLGRGLAEALALLRAHQGAGAPGGAISEVVALPAVGFELHLEGGARVRLGAAGHTDKLVRLGAVLASLRAADREALTIWLDDERHPDRVAVRLRPPGGAATATPPPPPPSVPSSSSPFVGLAGSSG